MKYISLWPNFGYRSNGSTDNCTNIIRETYDIYDKNMEEEKTINSEIIELIEKEILHSEYKIVENKWNVVFLKNRCSYPMYEYT